MTQAKTSSRMAAALALALVCLTARPARAEYRTVDADGLRVTVDSDWARDTAPGYLPVRFEISNIGDAREVEIAATARRYFSRGRYGPSLAASVIVRRTLQVPRGGRAAFTMSIPIGADQESVQLELREDGRTIQRLGGWNATSGRVGTGASAIIIAHPGSPFANVSGTWPRELSFPGRVVPPGATPATLPKRDLSLEPARAPADWLGWTSTQAVFLGDEEWRQLKDPQRAALLGWVASGGDLVLVDASLSSLFQEGKAPDVRASGDIADYFLGRIHTRSSESIDTQGFENVLTALETTPIDQRFALPVNRSADWGTAQTRGFRLPIPGVNGVPTRVYLTILFLFSVLIGPINYLFLKRRRLQVLFVLTAPVIAVVFIALLAAYVVVGEGFGVRGRAFTLTWLDQDRKQAATRATASLYAAGRTPAGGLVFPSDMAVVATGADGGVTREELRIDLTDSQRITSGAIKARAASNLETVGFRTARERLGFEWQGDQVSVVNGLGQPVKTILLREGGRYYRLTRPLPPGERAAMTAGGMVPSQLLNNDGDAMFHFGQVVLNQPAESYVAVLDRSPFWVSGTADVDERGSVHVVVGTGIRQP